MAVTQFSPKPRTQRDIAEALLRLQSKIAPDVLLIDGYKDALRQICEDTGSFIEEVQGLGSVEARAGREAALKGTAPEIVTQAWYALSRTKQDKLIATGLVNILEQWSKAAKPSITVRL